MAKATMPTAALLLQMSVVLTFFLVVCMARNIAELEPAMADHQKVISQKRPLSPPSSSLPNPFASSPPSSEPTDPSSGADCTDKYAVKKGQTCYYTWTKYHLKPDQFYALNPGIDCDNLDIGQELCVAGPAGADN